MTINVPALKSFDLVQFEVFDKRSPNERFYVNDIIEMRKGRAYLWKDMSFLDEGIASGRITNIRLGLNSITDNFSERQLKLF